MLPRERVCSSFTLLLRHRDAQGQPARLGDNEDGYSTHWEADQLPLIQVTTADVGCDQWRVRSGRLFGHEFSSDRNKLPPVYLISFRLVALRHYVNSTGTQDGRLCLLLQDLHGESRDYPNTGMVLRDLFSEHCRAANACRIDPGASG
ncbi:hypothetical protein MRX96_058884 [Rhipicephalus microplus]